MSTCFVIQPFDGDKYDQRYTDVFEPAIKDAGLSAYRVDQDPAVEIPIDDIENGIRGATICFAEISENNPNVWFELGFALAANKPTVMVCSEERTGRFPFDVQHRNIIKYKVRSPSDFAELKQKLTDSLKAKIATARNLREIAPVSRLTETQGLRGHEAAVLAAIAQDLQHHEDGASTYRIKQAMGQLGFSGSQSVIAIRSLMNKGMIDAQLKNDDFGDSYGWYSLNSSGWVWLAANLDMSPRHDGPTKSGPDPDDIPF
jgi:hypothetical protein